MNNQTMDDLIRPTLNNIQPQNTWRSRKYNEEGFMSSRSFKIYPENSLPVTARGVQNGRDNRQEDVFDTLNTARLRDGPDEDLEAESP